jgi:hypothetical protein
MADEKKGGVGPLPLAKFCNLAQISHTNHEFFFEFAQTSGRPPGAIGNLIEAQLLTRLVMTPQHAKQLLNALKTNVENYERKFGQIQIHELPVPPRGEIN